MPHQLLFKKRRGFIGKPDVLVIDESFHGATLHGTDRQYKVPLAGLLDHREVPLTLNGTADLRAISHKTHAVAAKTKGRLSRRDLMAAGLTAGDFRAAYALEWRRKLELGALPRMPMPEVKALCERVRAHNRIVAHNARLWALLAKTMEAPDEFSPWVEVRAEPSVDGLAEEVNFVLVWRDDIHHSWQYNTIKNDDGTVNYEDVTRTIILDATLKEEIVREFYPDAQIIPLKNNPSPHVYVRQCSDTAFAAGKFIPSEGANDRTNATRRNNVERIRRYIEIRAANVWPGKALIICQQGLETELKDGAIPDNVELAHFNNITGLNNWSDVSLLIVIGRTEPSPRTIERIARALFGCTIAEVAADEKGNIRWPQRPQWIRHPNNTSTIVQNNFHPDAKAEAVRWSVCIGELLQSIGRGRGIRREADNPLQVDILVNIALPIIVDETIKWAQMQPGHAQVMAARGAVPIGYADMATAYPDLFPSADAARMSLNRENPEQTPIDLFLFGICSGFLEIAYRRPGSRGPAGRLLYDARRVDPVAWLRAKFGSDIIIKEANHEAA